MGASERGNYVWCLVIVVILMGLGLKSLNRGGGGGTVKLQNEGPILLGEGQLTPLGTMWYIALFTVSYFFWEFLRISGNGERRNLDNFYFFSFLK